jgi:GTPase SAR1 family protein
VAAAVTDGSLEAHLARKQALLGALRELAELAGTAGLRTLQRELLSVRIPTLEEERFHLVVLGEFNHGKTTFVNALLGAEVLPTGITPTTAAINHLVWGEPPRARVVRANETAEIDVAALASWLTVEGTGDGQGERADGVRYVELEYPAPLLRDRVTLVDTPGVNDLNLQRAEITYSYIPRADAILFLLDATQVLKQSERHFLAQRVLAQNRTKLIFILGKADLLDDAELTQVVQFARAHLATLVPDPPVFAVSARRELHGDREASGFDPLLRYLPDYLVRQRGAILLANALDDGVRLARYVRQHLGIQRSSLDLDVQELEVRVARVRELLDGTRRSLLEATGKIVARVEAIKARAQLDVDDFVASFTQAAHAEIDRARGRALRGHLQRYLEARLRQWAEEEADRVGQHLESLAEEIIQVTNRRASELARSLATELGQVATQVELNVDTFKYDLGVAALGAVGTTLLIFVNALAGGLLTLAAPILAAVLSGKITGELRQQAHERVPEAIARAGQSVRQRLDQIIDDFAHRLTDFLIVAGDSLHQGIAEVLEAALATRRTRGDELSALRSELDEQLAALERLQGRLAELVDTATPS